MIKLEYLRYFQVAADKKSFASAANFLCISTTSIVNAVNQLEDHYDVSLFVRKKSVGLVLTLDGKKLLRKTQSLLNEVEAIDDAFSSSEEGITGELVVGCQEGLTWSLLPRVIGHLKKKHPNLHIIMKTTWMEEGYAPLENGDLDILVTYLFQKKVPSNIEASYLCRPKTCAMMRKGHPLDKEKGFVTLEELAQYPQVMINDGEALKLFYGMYEKLGLAPEIQLMSNISTGAQSIVGRTNAVSLRNLRPTHNLSPLNDPIVFPEVSNDLDRPNLVALTNKLTIQTQHTKHATFIKELQAVFDSGEMRQHIYY